MRAVVIGEPGGPEVLRWQEVPSPSPGPSEVLIEVAAAGVNRADLLQRQGFYPPPAGASEYPGLECSGRIAAVGSDVSVWRVGDEVCALLSGGGYAELVVVDQALVLPVPAGVDLVEAAGLPEAVATVWSNVFQIARLAEQEWFLVHGGAGGIGTFAIQLANAWGATVMATARASHRQALTALGADVVVDYRDEDFVEVVARRTGGRGVDVILDNMGASYLDRNIAALAHNGRIAVIGLQGGRKATLDMGALMARRGSISGTGLRARPLVERAAILDEARTEVWPLIESGAVAPVVAATLPMSEAAQAHRLLDQGGHLGKVLLAV